MQRVQIGKQKGGVPARNLSPRDHFILFVINAEYATSCGSFLSGEGTSERGCGAGAGRGAGPGAALCAPGPWLRAAGFGQRRGSVGSSDKNLQFFSKYLCSALK